MVDRIVDEIKISHWFEEFAARLGGMSFVFAEGAALVLFLIGSCTRTTRHHRRSRLSLCVVPWSIPMRRLPPRHLCPFHQRLLALLPWLLMCLRRLRCAISFHLSTHSGCRMRMVGQSTSGLGLAGGIEVVLASWCALRPICSSPHGCWSLQPA
jgi:hypothetical protein